MSAFVWDYFKTSSAILNEKERKKKKKQANVFDAISISDTGENSHPCNKAYMYAL